MVGRALLELLPCGALRPLAILKPWLAASFQASE